MAVGVDSIWVGVWGVDCMRGLLVGAVQLFATFELTPRTPPTNRNTLTKLQCTLQTPNPTQPQPHGQQVHLHSMRRIDVTGRLGATTAVGIPLRLPELTSPDTPPRSPSHHGSSTLSSQQLQAAGKLLPHQEEEEQESFVQAFSSDPAVIWPAEPTHCPFALSAASVAELKLLYRPQAPGRQQVAVHVVALGGGRLRQALMVEAECRLPAITRTIEVRGVGVAWGGRRVAGLGAGTGSALLCCTCCCCCCCCCGSR